jgi:hypothetical protein
MRNVAFEAAGWKNAIRGELCEGDSTMSLEDTRFSVIRYFAADIQSSTGPDVRPQKWVFWKVILAGTPQRITSFTQLVYDSNRCR